MTPPYFQLVKPPSQPGGLPAHTLSGISAPGFPFPGRHRAGRDRPFDRTETDSLHTTLDEFTTRPGLPSILFRSPFVLSSSSSRSHSPQ
jgi:hypothetical protein